MIDPEEYRIDFVQLVNGRIPFIKFLEELEMKERAEVLATIEEFRQRRTMGVNIPLTISKHLNEGIFEYGYDTPIGLHEVSISF